MNREIDALIAEKVMGLGKIEEHGGKDVKGRLLLCASNLGEKCTATVPFYSTDIAAAFEVVRHLLFRNQDLEFTLESNCGEWKAGLFHAGPGHYYDSDWKDTAEESICLAALKAMGVEIPKSAVVEDA